MEGIFTLPYSEYEVINEFSKYFKRTNGCGVFIPLSRQQKGTDFLLLNLNNGKSLKIQVKGSRSYKLSDKKENNLSYGLWFNNFIEGFDKINADLYVLFGIYPLLSKNKNINSNKKIWKDIVLCFNSNEMKELLLNVKTKKEQKKDRFFGLEFNDKNGIFKGRGFNNKENISDHLLENYYAKIKERLELDGSK